MQEDHLFFEGVSSEASRAGPPPAAPMRLGREADGPDSSSEREQEEVDELIPWLLRQVGLDASSYRPRALQRRLAACLRVLGVDSTAEARDVLAARPELTQPAVDAVLLGVTEFYRDRGVFDELRDRVLPELLAGGRGLRIWSAACSEGHELYTVAMLLDRSGGLSGHHLLGSDCRPEALRRAREGVFAPGALRGLEEGLRGRYFREDGEDVRVDERLRAAVRWEAGDLLREVKPGPWDVVLWRNMAIYLRPEVAKDLWSRIGREVRQGGYLVTGKAEQPPRGMALRRVAACVYRSEPG